MEFVSLDQVFGCAHAGRTRARNANELVQHTAPHNQQDSAAVVVVVVARADQQRARMTIK